MTSERPASSRPDVSVVIPVYRGEVSVRELWERLRNTLDDAGRSFELILVEDGSPDNSWSVIQALSSEDDRVKGIRLSRNFGQHPAIAAGYDVALGDIIVLMDCDLEDRPESVAELLNALNDASIDIVYTIKEGERGGFLHQLTSIAFHRVFSTITDTAVPNNVGTLRAFRRKVLGAIMRYKEYNVLFGPLMFFIGFPSVFIRIERDSRRGHRSTYSFSKRLQLAARALASYSNLPHRIFFWVGAAAVVGSFLYTVTIVVQYLVFSVKLPPGLTVIALLLVAMTGLMMLSLGLIGNYVFQVYQEVLRRPRYLIREAVNVDIHPRSGGDEGVSR